MFNTAVHAEYLRDHKDYCFEFQNDNHLFNWKYVCYQHTSKINHCHCVPNSAMKQKRDAYVKRLNDIYYANLERVCNFFHNQFFCIIINYMIILLVCLLQ